MRAFALAVCFVLSSTPAFCGAYFCDHPGTPNPVQIYVTSPNAIELAIFNTAREGTSRDIIFEVQDKQGNVSRFDAGRLGYGKGTLWKANGLVANQTYCYQVWTRDDNNQGCRSEQPSGWVCAKTAPPYSLGVVIPH